MSLSINLAIYNEVTSCEFQNDFHQPDLIGCDRSLRWILRTLNELAETISTTRGSAEFRIHLGSQ